ncbi:MAG: hypothetical protein AAFO91_18885, partial [Bacteroidota bacterium]
DYSKRYRKKLACSILHRSQEAIRKMPSAEPASVHEEKIQVARNSATTLAATCVNAATFSTLMPS